MKAQTLVTIALVVLVVVYGIQTIQLMNIKEHISSGNIKVSPLSGAPSGQGGVPQNVQNLPEMVGGC
ncbi:MAG: hypothetical protein AABX70_02945 [Nanoarchaeota archaeon]